MKKFSVIGSLAAPQLTWTLRTSSFGADLINDVWWSEEQQQWVAVGSNNKIATSPDGINWTQRTSPFIEYAPINYNILGVHYSPLLNQWLIIEFLFGIIATSSDGINWNLEAAGFFSPTDLWWSDQQSLWVIGAGGSNTGIHTSTDGITWIARNAQFGVRQIYGVIYSIAESKWIAVGVSDSTHRGISQSFDGITWSQVTTHPQSLPVFRAIGYDERLRIWYTASTSYKSANALATWNNLNLIQDAAFPPSANPTFYSCNTWNGLTIYTGRYFSAGSLRGAITTTSDGITFGFNTAQNPDTPGFDDSITCSGYSPTLNQYLLGGANGYMATGEYELS